MVWPPSLPRDRKWRWPRVCTHSRVVDFIQEGNLLHYRHPRVVSRVPCGRPCSLYSKAHMLQNCASIILFYWRHQIRFFFLNCACWTFNSLVIFSGVAEMQCVQTLWQKLSFHYYIVQWVHIKWKQKIKIKILVFYIGQCISRNDKQQNWLKSWNSRILTYPTGWVKKSLKLSLTFQQ